MSAGRRQAADFSFFDARFLAFAHRGGAAYAPNVGHENTLRAFQAAVDLGYRYLETDVHSTRDGWLVAFHDDRLDRVTDATGVIADLTFDEVRAASIGDGLKIPTLAELFEAFPTARFNIDCKADSAVALLARTIVEQEATDRVCVSSFGVHRLRRLRQLLPTVPTAVSSRAIVQLRFAPFVTNVPVINTMIDSPGVALQLPVSTTVAGRKVRVLTANLVRAAHRAGRQVHAWTIDDADEMDRLIEMGVDGIFTDRIDTLKDVLSARALWSAA